MEYVNIITQEAITKPLVWPVVVVSCIAVAFAVAALVITCVRYNRIEIYYDTLINLLIHSVCMIPIMFLTMAVCSSFPRVETGRYKYEGTLDPNMTIVEFEELFVYFE